MGVATGFAMYQQPGGAIVDERSEASVGALPSVA